MKRNFKRLAWNLDVWPLLTAIDAQPDLWDEITARQDHPKSPHKDTRSIFIRGPRDISPGAAFFDMISVNYPARSKLPEVEPLIFLTHQLTKCEQLGRVMIVSLKPGGFITPHCDEGSYAGGHLRIHISLQSGEGNVFTCGPESVHMGIGEAWWFDHRKPHEVRNDSTRERIHLIIDWVKSV